MSTRKKKPSKSKPDHVLACLIAARKRLTPEGAWCQGDYAKDARGHSSSMLTAEAVSWCALGATGCDAGSEEADEYLHDVLGECVPAWNDAPGRTQKQVLALFDKAIALRRKAASK